MTATLLLLACDDGPEITPFRPPEISGCSSVSTQPCDIRDEACIKTVQAIVICLRGGQAPALPSVQYMTQDELRELYVMEAVEPTAEEQAFNFFLERSGLLLPEDRSPEAQAASAATSVGGFYDPVSDELVVVTNVSVVEGDQVAAVLAHELVHHLQDLEVDLTQYGRDLTGVEGSQRRSTMVEGEANLYDSMFLAARLGHNPRTIDYETRFGSWVKELELGLSDRDRSPWFSSVFFYPYAYGARHVAGIHKHEGQEGIRRAFDAPPSTASLMGFGPEQGIDRSFEGLEGARVLSNIRMGAWTLFVSLSALLRSAQVARPIVETIEAEQLFLFVGEGDDVPIATPPPAFVWELRFSGVVEAQTAYSQLRSIVGDQTYLEGKALYLIASMPGFESELGAVFGW